MPAGDGWVHCAAGHKHWGLFGAAGLLLRHFDADGTTWLLMQHRAAWSHHGGTWGLLGGARAPGESAGQAARREALEEAGLAADAYSVTDQYLDDHGGWSYTTVFAEASALVPVTDWCAESAEVVWVPERSLAELPLHPGFAATWPVVRAAARGPLNRDR
jgi:8-oxo-dGTP pyrophosphatase MutT (NUDIX family)